MGILVVVAAGCYTFGNHRTKAVSPRGLAEAYFFSPLKKKRPPGLLSSHVPEQIKTLTSFWGHHGWLGMQPSPLQARAPAAHRATADRAGGHSRLSSRLDEASGGAEGFLYSQANIDTRKCRSANGARIPGCRNPAHFFLFAFSAFIFFFCESGFFVSKDNKRESGRDLPDPGPRGKCTTPLEYGFNTATTHGIKLVKKLVALSSSVPAGRGLAIGMYPIARGLLCAGGPHSRDGALWLIDGSYSQSVAHHLASI